MVELQLLLGERLARGDPARAAHRERARVERGEDREDADVEDGHGDDELDQAEPLLALQASVHLLFDAPDAPEKPVICSASAPT